MRPLWLLLLLERLLHRLLLLWVALHERLRSELLVLRWHLILLLLHLLHVHHHLGLERHLLLLLWGTKASHGFERCILVCLRLGLRVLVIEAEKVTELVLLRRGRLVLLGLCLLA